MIKSKTQVTLSHQVSNIRSENFSTERNPGLSTHRNRNIHEGPSCAAVQPNTDSKSEMVNRSRRSIQKKVSFTFDTIDSKAAYKQDESDSEGSIQD